MYPKQVTISELINILSEKAGAAPISFTAVTQVGGKKGLNKKNRDTKEPNPFGEVWKTARVNGWVNISYAKAMEKETGEEYVPGESWHDAALDVNERLTPFAEHPETKKLYLRVVRPRTLASSLGSTTKGKVEMDQLAPYLSPQGEEKPVAFRTYGLESIRSVSFNGEEYIVVAGPIELAKEEERKVA